MADGRWQMADGRWNMNQPPANGGQNNDRIRQSALEKCGKCEFKVFEIGPMFMSEYTIGKGKFLNWKLSFIQLFCSRFYISLFANSY
jgi:hypothetical protein